MSENTASGFLKPGDLLNNTYEIEALIGKGGAGEVYRAKNTLVANRTVAIKILLQRHAADPQFRAMMAREVEVLEEITHPAVVRYRDLHATEEFTFLVMEFIDGPSLEAVMKGGPVAPDALLTLAGSVLDGLEACHARSVYHRDISPDNVLLRGGRPEGATLIDFGIAKDVRPEAQTVIGVGFAGKYEYAAPEQFDGHSDHRSDFYSLGATLLAAARGAPLDGGGSIAEILRRKAEPLDTDGVPEPLRSLIDRLAHPDPMGRPQDVGEARALLTPPKVVGIGGLLDDLPPGGGGGDAAPPPGPPPGKGRTAEDGDGKKKGGRGLLLAGALALAGAIAALMLVPGLRERVLGPGLPTADPYTMALDRTGEGGSATGFAPSEEEREALARALGALLGEGEIDIGAALGAPNERWADMAEALARALADLDSGSARLEDDDASLEGVAPDPGTRERVERGLRSSAGRFGYDIAGLDLSVAPQPIPRDAVVDAVARHVDCGALTAAPPPPGGDYPPDARLRIEGQVATEEGREALERALSALGPDVTVDLSGVRVINPPVCELLTALPPVPDSVIGIEYTSDLTDARVGDDLFDPADAPIIDVTVPSNMKGRLYAFVADNEYNLFHLRPAPDREENRLAEFPDVALGERRVRVAFSVEQGDATPYETPALGFQEPYDEMIVFALVTPEPLFEELRPEVEDTRDFVAALSERLARMDGFEQAQRFLGVVEP